MIMSPIATTSFFVLPFATSYKRVNKAGCRNLRCFPTHSAMGHRDTNFCGQAVSVFFPGISNYALHSPPAFFAEFALQSSPTKTELTPGPGCFMGEIGVNDLVIFNKACHGWHYGWTSNKHTNQSLHTFRVYIVQEDQPIQLLLESTPFVISSFRNQTSKEIARLAQTDPLRLILQAIRLRFKNSMDMEWEDLSDWEDCPGVWMDGEQVQLVDLENQEKLLAIERFDAVLGRVSSYIFDNFPNWNELNDLKVDLNKHLAETESTSIEHIATEARHLFGAQVEPPPPVVFPENLTSLTQSTIADLKTMFLSSGIELVPEFTSLNDVSGCYHRPKAFAVFMDDIRARLGWSALERNIFTTYLEGEACLNLRVVSANEICFSSSEGTGVRNKSMMLKINEPFCPPQAVSGLLHSPFGKMWFVFAHTKGFVIVVFDGSAGLRVINSISKKTGGATKSLDVHRKIQLRSGNTWVTEREIEGQMEAIEEGI